MKNKLFILMAVMLPSIAFAQLKVNSAGRVMIGASSPNFPQYASLNITPN